MKRHQHHLRQKQPPTLLLSEQKGWVNNISQHFFLKLYYTRSHCHALGWYRLIVIKYTCDAYMSHTEFCYDLPFGCFCKALKENCDSAALLPPHIETQPTHTETSEAWKLKRCNLNLIRQIVSYEAIRLFNPRVSSLAEILERRDGHLEKNVNCVEQPSYITSTTSTSMIRNNLWI